MAKVPRTAPDRDRIGVDQALRSPQSITASRQASPCHRGSTTRSATTTCALSDAAIPHGPTSCPTGTSSTARSKPGGRFRPAPKWNLACLSTSRIEQCRPLPVASAIVHSASRTTGRGSPVATSSRSRLSPVRRAWANPKSAIAMRGIASLTIDRVKPSVNYTMVSVDLGLVRGSHLTSRVPTTGHLPPPGGVRVGSGRPSARKIVSRPPPARGHRSEGPSWRGLLPFQIVRFILLVCPLAINHKQRSIQSLTSAGLDSVCRSVATRLIHSCDDIGHHRRPEMLKRTGCAQFAHLLRRRREIALQNATHEVESATIHDL